MHTKAIWVVRIVGALAVVVFSFFITLEVLDWFAKESTPPAPLVSKVEDLPPLMQNGAIAINWDSMEGLVAQEFRTSHVVPGQPVEIVTVSPQAHAPRIGIRFSGLDADRVYRVTTWVKPLTSDRIVLELRDGNAARDGAISVELSAKTVFAHSGKIEANGIEIGADGWLKPWADLRISNPYLFATLNVSVSQKVSKQALLLGGFQIDAQP